MNSDSELQIYLKNGKLIHFNVVLSITLTLTRAKKITKWHYFA